MFRALIAMSTQATDVTPLILDPDLAVGGSSFDAARAGRYLGAGALTALPGALTLYLSFNAGGFYPAAQGGAVAILAGVVALRMACVRDPFAGFGRPLRIAVGALAFYSLWSLLSAHWSHAPARALLDFDLVNLYLFTLILFGSATRSQRRLRWMMVSTWLAMLLVCVVALATRLRPDLFPIPLNLSPDRLAYPLGYWNALGLFAAVGMTLGLYFASSTRESGLLRVLATAALPVFGVTILLTYSRSAIILGAAGLLAYALLARPRGLLGAVIAAAPTSAFAIAATYQAKLISNADTSAAAIQQGKHLTSSILIACAAAALARVALLELDTRLASLTISARVRHNWRILLAVVCGALLIGTAVGFGGQISTQLRNFTKGDSTLGDNDVRNRIKEISIGERLPGWKIAIQSFDRSPADGLGAGTFPIDYYRLRKTGGVALEAHSLYLEAMAELGLVGLAAILVVVVMLIGACFVRSRRASRSLWIAIAVVGLMWAVHAGVDWDWEMPAVTLPVFALAATALTRRGGRARLPRHYELPLRVAVAALAVWVAVTAARISFSDGHLDRSIAAFNTGNCPAAIAQARATISLVSSRPQAYQIIALCDVVKGRPGSSVALADKAVALDPQDWDYRYSLAIAQAAIGQNPHPELLRAEQLNPLEQMIQQAELAFRGRNRRRWERSARTMQMLVASNE